MSWKIVGLDPYNIWFKKQIEPVQERILALYLILTEEGPELDRPHVGAIENSQFRQMKELIIPHDGHEYRIFFAFDKERKAVLLLGGDKKPAGTYDDAFYDRNVPKADALFQAHLDRVEARKKAEKQQHQPGKKHGKRNTKGKKGKDRR